LVEKIRTALPAEDDLAALEKWLNEQYTEYGIQSSFGESRQERNRNIRRYHFQNSIPWLAQIIDRRESDQLQWVMVEEFSDRVGCMDPYAWDDIDESFNLSYKDFIGRWELAGAHSFNLKNSFIAVIRLHQNKTGIQEP
jgi:hypothetical protein